ncbi:MAG: hypothetical protein R2828_07965 [Saprospiraceae bacterium]
MNKLICWIAFTFLLYSPLQGQEKFTVVYTQGQVNFFNGSNNIGIRVIPGKLLPAVGVIRCEAGGMAKLIFKGKKHQLESGLEYDLSTLAKDSDTGNTFGFVGRFWNFVGASVNNTEDKKKLEKYHQKYMAEAKGGISGYGEGKNGLLTFDYLAGPLAGEEIYFEWMPKEGVISYSFEIHRQVDKSLFFKALPKSNGISLNLGQLNFKPAEVYTWEAKGEDADGQMYSTGVIQFSYEAEAFDAFWKDEDRLDELRSVADEEKDLLIVYQLEEEGFLLPAYTYYQQLLKDQPDNTLYKRLFAAFLTRTNNLEMAKKILADIN